MVTLDRLEALGREWDICYLGYIEPVPVAQRRKGAQPPRRRPFIAESARPPVLAVTGGEGGGKSGEGSGKGGGEGGGGKVKLVAVGGRKKRGHVLSEVGFAWGMHAYILRRSGAAKLVRCLPMDGPVDVFVSALAMGGVNLKALAAVQVEVHQDKSLLSDIAHSGMLRGGAF